MVPSRHSRPPRAHKFTLTSDDVTRIASSPSLSHASKSNRSADQLVVDVNAEIQAFEAKRVAINAFFREKKNSASFDVKRKRALKMLADDLFTMSLSVFRHIIRSSWAFESATSREKTEGYTLLYKKHTLRVYKKEFGDNRMMARGEFIIPVSPYQYSTYASSLAHRKEWDDYLDTATVVERVNDTTDLCYLAFRRLKTLSPRDCINLRTIKQIKPLSLPGMVNCLDSDGSASGLNHGEPNTSAQGDGLCAFCSCTCSVVHPDYPDNNHKVRADVKVGCYLAEPYLKQKTSEAWTKVYMFSEMDPCGWIPLAASQHFAAKVLPHTVERIVSCVLEHYGIPWRNAQFYCPKRRDYKKCASALEYCALRCANVPQNAVASPSQPKTC